MALPDLSETAWIAATGIYRENFIALTAANSLVRPRMRSPIVNEARTCSAGAVGAGLTLAVAADERRILVMKHLVAALPIAGPADRPRRWREPLPGRLTQVRCLRPVVGSRPGGRG